MHLSTSIRSIQSDHADPEKTFLQLFGRSNISDSYESKIFGRGGKGIDRMNFKSFEATKGQHIDLIERKVLAGSYVFAPYLELLKSKGARKPPRIISIPTIRDRIVLNLLKELLHQVFPECVNRTLPNARVREIKSFYDENKPDGLSYLRSDIREFYDSINHTILTALLRERIQSERIMSLLLDAIKSPTVPANSRTDVVPRIPSDHGVPQGLAISNILADIYLHKMDSTLASSSRQYHRHVDDIFLMSDSSTVSQLESVFRAELMQLSLSVNEKKTTIASATTAFEYLGYKYSYPDVSVRQSTVERFLKSIAGLFTSYKIGATAHIKRHPGLTADIVRNVFIEDLNEKKLQEQSATKSGMVGYFIS